MNFQRVSPSFLSCVFPASPPDAATGKCGLQEKPRSPRAPAPPPPRRTGAGGEIPSWLGLPSDKPNPAGRPESPHQSKVLPPPGHPKASGSFASETRVNDQTPAGAQGRDVLCTCVITSAACPLFDLGKQSYRWPGLGVTLAPRAGGGGDTDPQNTVGDGGGGSTAEIRAVVPSGGSVKTGVPVVLWAALWDVCPRGIMPSVPRLGAGPP